MMKSRKWGISLLALTLVTLCLLGSVTAIIDPFFHYHKPLEFLQYPIDDQRYQNDGIARHFDYDAVITGTSLTENFLASQMNDLFGVNAVKICFSGSTFTELNNSLRRALSSNPDIKLVLFAIDSWFLFEEKGAMRTDAEFPTYLYDDNPFNDVEYLLNKQVLCDRTAGVLEYTRYGGVTTNFDDYSFWGDTPYGQTGKDIALRNSPREPLAEGAVPFTEAERLRLTEGLTENTIRLAVENPDIQFLYFFPPYSILYWDLLDRSGTMERQLEAWRLASSLLLEVPNIRLFSFHLDVETVTDLNNYRDNVHYGSHINSLLMERMARGDDLLTPENADAHWQAVADFYKAYNYDAIYE